MSQENWVVTVISATGTFAVYLYYNDGGFTVDIVSNAAGVALFLGLLMMGVAINRYMRFHFAQKLLDRVDDEGSKKRIIDWYIGGHLKERIEIVEEVGSRVGGYEEE